MTQAPGGPIRHVSDTALWVAMYRAFESERPDAIFRDPYARRLAGPRGEAIVRSMPSGRAMAWPMIVRTAVMDEIILRLVGRDVTTVLNLAAGLDTRAFRLPLPPALRWFDVDLPDMVAYRREHLAGATPVCGYEAVAADLTDPAAHAAVLARVGGADGAGYSGGAGMTLVITEGLLVYLTAQQVAGLGRELAGTPSIRWWLTDLASPMLLKMLERTWAPHLRAANAAMRFAPAAGTAFFAPLGWREAEFRSNWEESLRLKRSMRLAWLWNLLGRLYTRQRRAEFRRMAGVVLFERA